MTDEIEEARGQWRTVRPELMNNDGYSSIPTKLVQQIDRCIEQGQLNRAISAILEAPHKVLPAINEMFAMAASVTGLDSDEILRRTDFHHRDTAPERIESAFAEVRAINFLHQQEFTQIQPLRQQRTKCADIIASRDGEPYAVEVVTSIYEARGRFTPERLGMWLVERIKSDRKDKQVEASSGSVHGRRKVFLAVVDSADAVALQVHDEFQNAARHVWEKLECDSDTHVCFVTGRVTLGYGSDDAIFPQWPESKEVGV